MVDEARVFNDKLGSGEDFYNTIDLTAPWVDKRRMKDSVRRRLGCKH